MQAKKHKQLFDKIPLEITKKLALEVESDGLVSCFFSHGKYLFGLRLRRMDGRYREKFEEFKKFFGGNIQQSSKDFAWWYNLMGARAMAVMDILYPYLEGKRAQVGVCQELQARMVNKHRGKALPPEEHELRREIIAKLRKLNRESKP